MHICVCVWVQAHKIASPRGQKKASHPLVLELQVLDMSNMDARSQTQVLCKSSRLLLLSHLSSPSGLF